MASVGKLLVDAGHITTQMPNAPQLDWPQGQPLFETQWRAVAESLAGNGVQSASDLEVSATATDLEIEVASGTVFYIGQTYTLGSPSTFTLSPGDGLYDRWDTVYFDTATSSAGVREGSAAASPEPPDIQGDELLLAVVYVPQNTTDVPDSNILNWRAESTNRAGVIRYADSTGTYSVDNVDAALDELQEGAQISAYPLSNSDLANSSTTVNAGDGLTTTGASIALGGSATLDIAAGGVGTDELDLSITPTWTGKHTFDSGVDVSDPVTLNPSMFGTGLLDTEAAVKLPDFGASGKRIGFLSNTTLPSSPPTNATLQVGDFILNPSGFPTISRLMEIETDSNGAISGRKYAVTAGTFKVNGDINATGGLTVSNTLTINSDLEDNDGNEIYSGPRNEVLQARLAGPASDLQNYPLARHTDYTAEKDVAVTNGDYTVGPNEDGVLITDTSSPVTVTLDRQIAGAEVRVKDASGNAGTNAITVEDSGGDNIDGSSTYQINSDYGNQRFLFGNGQWWVV